MSYNPNQPMHATFKPSQLQLDQLGYVVLESKAAFEFGARFLDEEQNTSDYDTWIASPLSERRNLLNKFQKQVMDIFCDDLFMETILETPEADLETDVADTYRIYNEFITKFPGCEVVAIVPMTLTGTCGYVYQLKPEPPKTLANRLG